MPSPRDHNRDQLLRLGEVFDIHLGRYGAPRLYRVLRERHGYTGGLNRIKALMRAMGLRAKAGNKFKVTTDAAHSLLIAPKVHGQDFECQNASHEVCHWPTGNAM